MAKKGSYQVKISDKTNKQLEDSINRSFNKDNRNLYGRIYDTNLDGARDASKEAFDAVRKIPILFAFDNNSQLKNSDMNIWSRSQYYVWCDGNEVYLTVCENGIDREPIKFQKDEKIDCITQCLNYIRKVELSDKNVEITLASWVNKHLLDKYDAKCPLQFENIEQMGDSESLFSGPDACKKLDELFKSTEE